MGGAGFELCSALWAEALIGIGGAGAHSTQLGASGRLGFRVALRGAGVCVGKGLAYRVASQIQPQSPSLAPSFQPGAREGWGPGTTDVNSCRPRGV